MHAELIHTAVRASQSPEVRARFEPALQASEANGWVDLVARIRRILDGERSVDLLLGLDAEDRAIIEAILSGIVDPASLPPLTSPGRGDAAAPGLAQMIQAAAGGNAQALAVLAEMARQMSAAGGDMALLAAAIKPLIDGERDLDKLTRGMSAQGIGLVQSIVGQLNGDENGPVAGA